MSSQAGEQRCAATEATGPASEAAAAEDPVVQYIILRRDLWREQGWPLGSIVAQGCHASLAAAWLARDKPVTQAYLAPENIDSMHKVSALSSSGVPFLPPSIVTARLVRSFFFVFF